MRDFPTTFAHDRKALAIHPEGYQSSMPASLQETFHLCNVYIQHNYKTGPGDPVYQIRQISETLSLILPRLDLRWARGVCPNFTSHTLWTSSPRRWLGAMVGNIKRCAWGNRISAVAESTHSIVFYHESTACLAIWGSVRRTIILTLVLRSAYSLKKRNYSTRNTSIEGLPFDLRMHLWSF